MAVAGEPCKDMIEAVPGQPPSPRAATQPLIPDPPNLVGVHTYAPRVAGDAEVTEVSPHHRTKPALLLFDRKVSVAPAEQLHILQRTGQPSLRGLPQHDPVSATRAPPIMSEAEKVEAALVVPSSRLLTITSGVEVDDARLVRM